MKPFDLQKALRGDPVVTRDGRPVTQITFFDAVAGDRIAGLLDGYIESWREGGRFYSMDSSEKDLFMAPKVKEGWINIYQTPSGEWRTYGPIYDSEEAAANHNADAVPPIRIEWEVP